MFQNQRAFTKPQNALGSTLLFLFGIGSARAADAESLWLADDLTPADGQLVWALVQLLTSGTRLCPATREVCKQPLPVYDKPMIYYSPSTLMLAGISDILINCTPAETPRFRQPLGDGSELGLRLEYVVQEVPNGLAQAFVLGRDFVGDDSRGER